MTNIKTFTAACVEAAQFTDTGADSEYESGASLTADSLADLAADCRSFWHRFGCYVTAEPEGVYSRNFADRVEMAGHDFWFTRNGHGAGFWDGDWPRYGDLLTDASELYGEFYSEYESNAV